VGEQHVDHRTAVQAGGVRAQVGVGPDQVAGVAGQSGEEPLEGGPVEGLLQVVDDVELDAALLEDAEGATGLASTRVVVQQQSISHAADGSRLPKRRRGWRPNRLPKRRRGWRPNRLPKRRRGRRRVYGAPP